MFGITGKVTELILFINNQGCEIIVSNRERAKPVDHFCKIDRFHHLVRAMIVAMTVSNCRNVAVNAEALSNE